MNRGGSEGVRLRVRDVASKSGSRLHQFDARQVTTLLLEADKLRHEDPHRASLCFLGAARIVFYGGLDAAEDYALQARKLSSIADPNRNEIAFQYYNGHRDAVSVDFEKFCESLD